MNTKYRIHSRRPSRGCAKEILKLSMEEIRISKPDSDMSIDTHRTPSICITFYGNHGHLKTPHIRVRGDLAYPEVLDALSFLLQEAKRIIANKDHWSGWEI